MSKIAKNIVHLGFYHNKEDIRIFCKECNTLVKAGYKVSYVTSDIYGDTKNYEANGVKVYFYSHQNPARNMDIKKKQVFRKKILKREWIECIVNQIMDLKPYVLHVHEYEVLFIVKALMKENPGIKIIYDLHEDNPKHKGEWYRRNGKGEIKARVIENIVRINENQIIKKSLMVFTATDYLTKIASKYNKNVFTIKNYPKKDDIYCSNGDLKERDNNYCYSGRITEDRGISLLIKISSDIKGKFLVAGNIEEHYCDKLKKEFSDEWEHNVVYRGFLTRWQVNELYASSVVGLCILQYHPNYINALPIKLFEYMAAGIPVVCSGFPIWKQIVEEAECGITVDPYDEKMIVNAINHLLSDRELAKRMGDNGKKAVKTKYSWENEEKILLDAYSKFI